MRKSELEQQGAHNPERLRDLAEQTRALATELTRLAGAPSEMGEDHTAQIASVDDELPDVRAERALVLLKSLQSERSRLFGTALASDPAWEMLMELMRGRLAGRRVSVSSLCAASCVPITTALRRIEDLIDANLVFRSRDPNDRRRSYVHLSEYGAEKMQKYLAYVERKLALKP